MTSKNINIKNSSTHSKKRGFITASGEEGAGFTLLELLVVIAIIGTLSAGVLASINSARESSRDAQRLRDMSRIETALELYYNENGDFPPADEADCSGWECSHKEDQKFVDILVDQGYLSNYPSDPVNDGTYHYRYHLYSSSSSHNCTSVDLYVLGIRNFESISGTHPDSPGWECPDRDWESEFDWVTAGFE